MTVANSLRARVVPNVIECSVYYDGPSDLISFVSYLTCFQQSALQATSDPQVL